MRGFAQTGDRARVRASLIRSHREKYSYHNPKENLILQLQRSIGNQAVLRLLGALGRQSSPTVAPVPAPSIQRKPAVSSPRDPVEREADEVSDAAMRMAESEPIGLAPVAIQHRGARDGGREGERAMIQAESSRSADAGALDPGAAVRAAERGGAPLPQEVRFRFEPRLGHDFSQVRVHADAEAAAGARAVRARAYTIGHDIVFGAGEYAPETAAGGRLLAHELVHVVQQAGAPTPAAPAIRRQEAPAKLDPLVQKLIDGTITPGEKLELRRRWKTLSQADLDAIERWMKEGAGKALVDQIVGQNRIVIDTSAETKDVDLNYDVQIKVRLSGVEKALAGSLEGTVTTIARIVGDVAKKTVRITIQPPSGDARLAGAARSMIFHDAPLVIEKGPELLAALNMARLEGSITLTLTGNKKSDAQGIVIHLPDIPSGVELEVTLSSVSGAGPRPAPPAPSYWSLVPGPRVFSSGGIISGPGGTRGVGTVGVDVPLFTDTTKSLIYGGLGARGGLDTSGAGRIGGSFLVGVHLDPLSLHLGLGGGAMFVPKGFGHPDAPATTSHYYEAEAGASYRFSNKVELMAIISFLGDEKNSIPGGVSGQFGVGYRFGK